MFPLTGISTKNSTEEALKPLAGLWTTPEVRKAFNDYTTTDIDPILKSFGAYCFAFFSFKAPKNPWIIKGLGL